ncbi:Oligopeptide transport system permease protein AppC [Hyphomicrobiales bacterium]|nr:Oligopeptide transport system permease protein AppC [Hyphomicrobiales bacterium]CAH1675490.1 Oligopeptide transport system permease protein AppC [Hyphomicrobiales bacterium]
MNGSGFIKRFLRHRGAVAGMVILACVLGMALSAPILFPLGPWEFVGMPMLRPGQDMEFPLGTDMLGRDMLTAVFYGGRVSLMIGLAAALSTVVVGTVIGSVAGYFGGLVDDLLMRFTELFQTIPAFLFAFVIVALFTPSAYTIILALCMIAWPGVARLVRGETMRLRRSDYVQTCVAIGMTESKIIFTQILPNCLAPIIVTASTLVASAILVEAGLSFLGLGDPNLMSWGTMIAIGRDALRSAWYLCAIPGVMILVTVLALNLIGDGLNDALNPHLRSL